MEISMKFSAAVNTKPQFVEIIPSNIREEKKDVSVDNLLMAMQGINKKIDTFREAVINILDDGDHLVLAFSSGKDSSCLATIALDTIADYKKRGGLIPQFAILHGNTKIENPRVNELALGKGYSENGVLGGEMGKIQKFMEENDLSEEGSIHVAEPYITSDYIVSIIGGRTIASMPDNDSKCSVDLKIEPMERLKKKVFKKLLKESGKNSRIITLIGTRHSESKTRSKKMQLRNESTTVPVKSKDGSWVLSPIADFTLEDVFLIFDYAKRGHFNTYSDLQSVMDLYGAAAEPGSCSLAAFTDDSGAGESCSSAKTGRFGCMLCTRVSADRSMENLIKSEEHGFMKPLNEFRNFIQDTHYDPNKRNWISRSVDDEGRITLNANAYSPQHCEHMLRIAISIDVREERAAAALGIAPRYQLITRERLIACEIYWQRYGYHSRFEACRIYNDVRVNGNEVDIPVVENPYKKLPKYNPVKLPFADKEYYSNSFNGFRDAMSASTGAETQISKGELLDEKVLARYGTTEIYLSYLSQRVFGGGDTYANYLRRKHGLKERGSSSQDIAYEEVPVADRMSFDEEGLNMFFDFPDLGINYYVNKYGKDYTEVSPTAGLFELFRLGFVSIKSGQQSEMDRMLRMGNQIKRLGVRSILNNPEALKIALKDIGSVSKAKLGFSAISNASVDVPVTIKDLDDSCEPVFNQRVKCIRNDGAYKQGELLFNSAERLMDSYGGEVDISSIRIGLSSARVNVLSVNGSPEKDSNKHAIPILRDVVYKQEVLFG